jgi:hypothetical protein
MRALIYGFIALAAASLPLAMTGCGPKPAGKKADTHGHDHDHDHGHDHAAHGPHEGHVLELGDEEYHAEWTYDDGSGKVTVYLLDHELKQPAPTGAETIAIKVKVGENEKEYLLEAVDRTAGDAPMASQFELVDKTLGTALITTGTDATLTVEIGGKPYTAKIEHDDHDGHHH